MPAEAEAWKTWAQTQRQTAQAKYGQLPSRWAVRVHRHTYFSMLDGVGKPEEYIAKAVEAGHPAVGVSDHGNIIVWPEYAKEAGQAGVQPILGVELYLGNPIAFLGGEGRKPTAVAQAVASRETLESDPLLGVWRALSRYDKTKRGAPFTRAHLLAVAVTKEGLVNLRAIVSQSYRQLYAGFPTIFLSQLVESGWMRGIAFTTGCLAGLVPRLLRYGLEEEAARTMQFFREQSDYFFAELQEHAIKDLTDVNHKLIPLAASLGIPLIFGEDAHYVHEEDRKTQNLLLKIATSKSSKDGGKSYFEISGDYYHVMPDEEIWQLLAVYDDDVQAAYGMGVAEMITATSDHLATEIEYTAADVVPDEWQMPKLGKTEKDLRRACYDGLHRLFPEGVPKEYTERVETEIGVISRMGFVDYFFLLREVLDYIEEQYGKIWMVRGSGAGSLVMYLMEITHIDPLPNGLIFERFLNPHRVTMPDVDVDIPSDIRGEVITALRDRFGKDNVALILSYGHTKVKSAFAEVLRAEGWSPADRIAVTKPIDNKAESIEDVLPPDGDFHHSDVYRRVLDIAKKRGYDNPRAFADAVWGQVSRLIGTITHAGVHAAGVVLFPPDRGDVHNYTAYYATKNAAEQQKSSLPLPAQADMGFIEGLLRLVKLDLLGVKTLQTINTALQLIERNNGKVIEFRELIQEVHRLPVDSEAAKLYRDRWLAAIFQVKSSGGMAEAITAILSTARKEERLIELLSQIIAAYRPGPKQFIPQIYRRRAGLDETSFPHPLLGQVLSDTYGFFLFQEQIIRALQVFAGFSPGEADMVRRHISKKKKDKIATSRAEFIQRVPQLHDDLDEKAAAALWDEHIAPWVGYGFNKSHSHSYAALSLVTAWLKVHYPREFYQAVLMVNEKQAEDRKKEWLPVLGEIRKRKLAAIRPPDVWGEHYSHWGDEGVILGWGAIKGFTERGAQVLERFKARYPTIEAFLAAKVYAIETAYLRSRKRAQAALPGLGETPAGASASPSPHAEEQYAADAPAHAWNGDSVPAEVIAAMTPETREFFQSYVKRSNYVVKVFEVGNPIEKFVYEWFSLGGNVADLALLIIAGGLDRLARHAFGQFVALFKANGDDDGLITMRLRGMIASMTCRRPPSKSTKDRYVKLAEIITKKDAWFAIHGLDNPLVWMAAERHVLSTFVTMHPLALWHARQARERGGARKTAAEWMPMSAETKWVWLDNIAPLLSQEFGLHEPPPYRSFVSIGVLNSAERHTSKRGRKVPDWLKKKIEGMVSVCGDEKTTQEAYDQSQYYLLEVEGFTGEHEFFYNPTPPFERMMAAEHCLSSLMLKEFSLRRNAEPQLVLLKWNKAKNGKYYLNDLRLLGSVLEQDTYKN